VSTKSTNSVYGVHLQCLRSPRTVSTESTSCVYEVHKKEKIVYSQGGEGGGGATSQGAIVLGDWGCFKFWPLFQRQLPGYSC